MLKDNTKFAYAVGRIRVLEDRMVDHAKLLRMIDAPDFETSFSVLNETSYAELFSLLKTSFDFEELLYLELERLKSLFDRLAPGNLILESLWFKYDALNIKTLIKAKLGEKQSYSLFKVGTIDEEALRYFIFEGTGDIPVRLKELINKVRAEYERNKDPEMIDIILDRHYFSKLKEASNINRVPFFVHLVNSNIDLANVKIFLRLKAEKRERDVFTRYFIRGGILNLKFFMENFEKSLEDFIAKFRFSPYHIVVSSGVDFYLKNGSFFAFDKLMDDYIMNYLKRAKFISFGIEPLIGYLTAKEGEIKNLRLILSSKQNHVKTELIKERCCGAYV